MGLRGGQDDDPSLDQGRRKVLTVLVPSHSLSPAGTKIQATEEPGDSEEKGDGLFGWGGRGQGVDRKRKQVVTRTDHAWPHGQFGTLHLSCWQQAPGEGEGKAPGPADELCPRGGLLAQPSTRLQTRPERFLHTCSA